MGRRNEKGSCPKHGTKYIIKEGAVYYCAAPTPNEITSKCFYHPRAVHPKESKTIKKKRKEEAKGKDPDVFRAMTEEWELHKKTKVEVLEKSRRQSAERKAQRASAY